MAWGVGGVGGVGGVDSCRRCRRWRRSSAVGGVWCRMRTPGSPFAAAPTARNPSPAVLSSTRPARVRAVTVSMTVTRAVSSLHPAHTARARPSSSAHRGQGLASGVLWRLLSLPRSRVASTSSRDTWRQSMRQAAWSLMRRGLRRSRARSASSAARAAASSLRATNATRPSCLRRRRRADAPHAETRLRALGLVAAVRVLLEPLAHPTLVSALATAAAAPGAGHLRRRHRRRAREPVAHRREGS